ncbi:unnamed protein product [Choristocarpus tenellus]|uniref:ribosomal protein S13 n=1 Tax=Choristocarpus tenellus TaxID=116065 RepID=UPI002E76EF5E|nr:ribosomal protein S13 [Choristocarpus tenellus]WBP69815.1 ribosomal protein S13 [Choristocarpus tenellus]
MSYIAGKALSENKMLVKALSHIFGIGFYQSKIVCQKAGLSPDARLRDLNLDRKKEFISFVEGLPLVLGKDLSRFNKDHIRLLKRINCYRGIRHRKGLPVRGQRTHTNSKPRKILKF